MFQSLGTVSSFIKTKALEYKWQERKQDPFKKKEKEKEEDPQVATLKKQAEDARKGQTINNIEVKMKSGERLSPKDMDYLRENSPDLYAKAVQLSKEREQYRRELEKCKTKEDVEKLNTRVTHQLLTEAKAIMNNSHIPKLKRAKMCEFINMRLTNFHEEHIKFIKTSEYNDLPQDERKKTEDTQVESIIPEEGASTGETGATEQQEPAEEVVENGSAEPDAKMESGDAIPDGQKKKVKTADRIHNVRPGRVYKAQGGYAVHQDGNKRAGENYRGVFIEA